MHRAQSELHEYKPKRKRTQVIPELEPTEPAAEQVTDTSVISEIGELRF